MSRVNRRGVSKRERVGDGSKSVPSGASEQVGSTPLSIPRLCNWGDCRENGGGVFGYCEKHMGEVYGKILGISEKK